MEKENVRFSGLKPVHFVLPVLIGAGVVAWMWADEFGNFSLTAVPLTPRTLVSLAVVIAMVVLREVGMTWRYRAITDGDLSWRKALKVCLMCEFTSAVTPSAVGGSSVAMVFMNMQGINFGRATTLMIVTLFLDELFFVLSCPIVATLTPLGSLFGNALSSQFSVGIQWVFWGIYAVIALWTALLFVGIVIKPMMIKRLLVGIFALPLLRRWKAQVEQMTDNMVAASRDLRHRTLGWWLRAFAGTVLLWVPRYVLVCALFWGLLPGSDLWLVFARQAVVWLVLMVCPTPGGSGLGEWLFTQYYADMIPTATLAMVIMLVWRIASYYAYLVAGLVLVPLWLGKKKQ
ncbi:MAG: lysylphosphatidylglycerol synthase transmembrane domain-containing protein [Bacteroidales bacterium]|nr:lysylphosphatidylglycerol synthase transmembrane domain-containing protein [Bacteroidales bacterium]